MKTEQRWFFKILLAVLLTVAVFGFASPMLISARGYFEVVGGISIIILWIWYILFPFGTVLYIKKFMGFIKSSMLIILCFVLIAVGCSKVPAGNVGIKVYLLGGDKGVSQEELGPGRYWIGINEELFIFPTFTQNYVWTKDPTEGSANDESITFQTIEGLEVSGDFGITYHIDPVKVSLLFQTYRRGIEEITDIFLRNLVRDEINKIASTLKVDEIYGMGKATMMDNINKQCALAVVEKGIIIEKISIVGKLRLPDPVVSSLNAKISATQQAIQAENELRKAEAEAKKRVAFAEGEAKANLTLAQSITPQLLQWKELEITQAAIAKWDGKRPMVEGGQSGLLMQIPLPTTQK